MTESLCGDALKLTLESEARSVSVSDRSVLPSAVARSVATAGWGNMRRLFCIWNRGYKTQSVIAVDSTEALELSSKSRHIKRPNMYRKFQDVTEETLAQDERLQAALDAGVSGVANLIEGNGWKIGDVIVS